MVLLGHEEEQILQRCSSTAFLWFWLAGNTKEVEIKRIVETQTRLQMKGEERKGKGWGNLHEHMSISLVYGDNLGYDSIHGGGR